MHERASDIMSTDLVWVGAGTSVREAARMMVERGVGSVLVLDGGRRLLGIVSEGDFVGKKGGMPFSSRVAAYIFGDYIDLTGLKAAYDGVASLPVRDVMTTDVATVGPQATLEEVISLMLERDVKRVPVVDGGHVVGVIARHDLLKVMTEGRP